MNYLNQIKAVIIADDYKEYEQDKIRELRKQGILVNYSLINFEQGESYSDLPQINHQLIKSCPNIIFKISKFYQATKSEIEYALYLTENQSTTDGKTTKKYKGRPCNIRIDCDNKTYLIRHKDEWKYTTQQSVFQRETFKHPVLILFDEALENYKTLQRDKRQQEVDSQVYEKYNDIESITAWCRAFAPQWNVDIDYNDVKSIATAYEQMQFYFDNNIPYELDGTEVFKGAIHPMDDGLFTTDMFQMPPYELDDEELITSYGNEDYFEDEVAKGVKQLCMNLR